MQQHFAHLIFQRTFVVKIFSIVNNASMSRIIFARSARKQTTFYPRMDLKTGNGLMVKGWEELVGSWSPEVVLKVVHRLPPDE